MTDGARKTDNAVKMDDGVKTDDAVKADGAKTAKPALTIARLTGSGPGAVAVYRLSGPKAADVLAEKIRLPGGRFLSADQWRERGVAVPKKPVFAHLLLDWSVPALREKSSNPASNGSASSAQNPPAEEVVLDLIDSETAEIDTHGGDSIAAAVFRTMEQAGAVRINPLEPYRPDKGSAIESFIQTAERLLPQVRTDWGAEILLDQCGGAAERFFRKLDESVLSGAVSYAEAADALDRMADTAVIGTHLIEPFQVVLAGPVNAGKSTLFNTLLGFDRAIADQTPGTTRDLLFADTAFDGVPIRLYDTAGFRATSDPIEQTGIQTAASRLTSADLVLLLTAAADETSGGKIEEIFEEELFLPDLPSERILRLRTKCDLLPKEKKSEAEPLPVSAYDSESIARLQSRIIRRLIPEIPPAGTPIALDAGQAAFYRRLSARFRTGKPLSNDEKASIMETLAKKPS